MKRLLITGSTGFIGYHLVEKALLAGFEVFATKRASSSIDQLKAFNIQFINVDLRDCTALTNAIRDHNIEYIIHNAGLTKALNPDEFNKVNVHITQSIIDAISKSKGQIRKFVFMSSMAVSGPGKSYTTVIDATDPDQPVTHYGKSKSAAEKIIKQNEQIPYLIFRPTAVYGPWERDILVMIKTLKAGFDLHLGKYPQALTFIYAKDLAELVIAALDTNISRATYLVSDGNVYDRYSFGNEVISCLNNKPIRIHLPIFIGQAIALFNEWISKLTCKAPLFDRDKLPELTAKSWRIDIQSIRNDFNFVPKYDLKAGIAESIRWYKKNKWL